MEVVCNLGSNGGHGMMFVLGYGGFHGLRNTIHNSVRVDSKHSVVIHVIASK